MRVLHIAQKTKLKQQQLQQLQQQPKNKLQGMGMIPQNFQDQGRRIAMNSKTRFRYIVSSGLAQV